MSALENLRSVFEALGPEYAYHADVMTALAEVESLVESSAAALHAETERGNALAVRVAELRGALLDQAGTTPGPDVKLCWCNNDDCRCTDRPWCVNARDALEATEEA